jgi:hypothetical protein
MTNNTPRQQDYFGEMRKGLTACLADIWSLEVNTMVVSRIGGFKFNPYTGYEKIYRIPTDIKVFEMEIEKIRAQNASNGENFISSLPAYIVTSFVNNNKRTPQEEKSIMSNYIVLRKRLQYFYNYETSLDDIREDIRKDHENKIRDSGHAPDAVATGLNAAADDDLLPLPEL